MRLAFVIERAFGVTPVLPLVLILALMCSGYLSRPFTDSLLGEKNSNNINGVHDEESGCYCCSIIIGHPQRCNFGRWYAHYIKISCHILCIIDCLPYLIYI
jgi:hypothetical protein